MSHDILIVDDEADIREIVSGVLLDEGYKTRVASDGVTAISLIKQRQPSLVILDVWLGDGERDGLRILDLIKRDHPYVPVVMISGHSTIETAVSAIKKGAYDFIEKPFQTDRLLLVIQRAIESSRLKQENDFLRIKARMTATTLCGSAPQIQQIRQSIHHTSASNSRLFIMGPLGAEKETIAREIHNNSKRAGAPFFVVNCSALHPTKLEVELLGTEIATKNPNEPRKIGILEKASGGTVYFDEITALPLPFQSKLVKILTENSFIRVGGVEKIPVDIRFIAGSSDVVPDLIKHGDFREDLYYRLSVVTLHIPALKERNTDIPLLAQKLMEDACAANRCKPRQFSEEAIILLQAYDWPGDLVQLKNAVDWLLIMHPHETDNPILAKHLPPEILKASTLNTAWNEKTADIVVLPLREAREVFEKEYLLAQVNRFAGNISQTARFIGMERSALHRKLRALKLYDPRVKEEDDDGKDMDQTA